jgi:CubicO group peptidase (beta-lactamase class C family)
LVNNALRVATAYAARRVASGLFIEGQPADATLHREMAPHAGLSALRPVMKIERRGSYAVRGTLAGFFANTAGCAGSKGILVNPGTRQAEGTVPFSAPNRPFRSVDHPLVRAILANEIDQTQSVGNFTKTIVVIRGNDIIGEAYGPGFNASTPILGYSLSKLLAVLLAGYLVQEGLLDPGQPDPAGLGGPGKHIPAPSLASLLSMTSGLDFDEKQSGADRVSRMLFLEQDMARFAAQSSLRASPGERWAYSSGNTLLASYAIAAAATQLGGFDALLRRVAHRAGLGMVHVDRDHVGTPILSSFSYMTARSYAALGCIVRDGGRGPNGRIYGTEWRDRMAQPSAGVNYGFALRLNDRSAGIGKRLEGVPEDAVFTAAFLGQMIAVVPSRDLVVARLSAMAPRGFDRFARLLSRIITVVDETQP